MVGDPRALPDEAPARFAPLDTLLRHAVWEEGGLSFDASTFDWQTFGSRYFLPDAQCEAFDHTFGTPRWWAWQDEMPDADVPSWWVDPQPAVVSLKGISRSGSEY